MTTLARRNSSIHKIREYALPKVNLEDEYEVLHVMQEGWRGRLLLVEHRRTRNEVVLKAVHKQCTSRVEFFREFHYNYYLSPHTNILNAYDVAFQAGDYFIFAQEYAPFGDLTSNLSETGLGENNVKKIAPQLVSALEFMHSKDLVHRNLNMDNVLVFNIDFSEVKLCDFGSTRKNGSLLKKKTVWLPYAPPEIVDTVQNEGFHVSTKQDVWQLGVLLYVLLTGALPWQKADVTDPHYVEFISWKKRKTLKTPKRFSNFTARALRMFKRLLEPKPEKRSSVSEVCKYLEDKWLVRPMKKDSEVDNQSVCYSTFSIHSSKIEKDRVLYALKAHGIETTVDRIAKRKRIHEWIERSLSNNLMFEEDEGTCKNNPSEHQLYATFVNENNILSEIQSQQLKSTNNYDVTPFHVQKNLNKSSSMNMKSNVHLRNQENHSTELSYDRSMLIGGSNKNSAERSLNINDELKIVNNADSKENSPNRESPSRLNIPNVKRRSSFQEYKKSQSTQDSSNTPNNNYNQIISSRINSSKSHYHQSPTRDPFSPLRVHSRSQKVLSKQNDNQMYTIHTDDKEDSKSAIQTDRSRHFQKSGKSGRSAASRIKSEAYQRSRSLARNPISSDYEILRSNATNVDHTNHGSLSRHGSEDSVYQSNDSLTSVIPALGFC